jgi:O-antigen ligase
LNPQAVDPMSSHGHCTARFLRNWNLSHKLLCDYLVDRFREIPLQSPLLLSSTTHINMDILLLYIFAFLRPILLVNINTELLGFNILDLIGIALLAIILIPIAIHAALYKVIRISVVDLLLFIFIFWSISVALIYPEHNNIKHLIRWVSPFLPYFIAKNVLTRKEHYAKAILLLIAGLAIMICASAIAIFLNLDIALDRISYFTDLPFYIGLFRDPNTLGQSAAFLVMLCVIYGVLSGADQSTTYKRSPLTKYIVFVALFLAAIYCMISSQTRTAILGLVIFFSIYLYLTNKKRFTGFILTTIVIAVIAAPFLGLLFNDIVEVQEGERPIERIASGRPYIWAHNLSEYSKISFDRKLIGAGIGNISAMGLFPETGGENFWSSHNDFLSVLIYTGIIGLVVFLMIQLAIFRNILSMSGREKYVFLSLFLTSVVIQFASNGFLAKYALGQMLFLVLSYSDRPIAATLDAKTGRRIYADT